ncbi:hypothetical protein [Rhodobacteraceae bacterium DSL-40]|uniref:hypothetical protein n=1 Tax=Amaricoccus sp. B4 TaxID=3368557 RepID=UPI0013A6D756
MSDEFQAEVAAGSRQVGNIFSDQGARANVGLQMAPLAECGSAAATVGGVLALRGQSG